MDPLDHTQLQQQTITSSLINRPTHSETHSTPWTHKPNSLKMGANNNLWENIFQLDGVLSMEECAHQDLDQPFNQLPPLFQIIKTHKIPTRATPKPQIPLQSRPLNTLKIEMS